MKRRGSCCELLAPVLSPGDEYGAVHGPAVEEIEDEEFDAGWGVCSVEIGSSGVGGSTGEKKRRLTMDQVRALERNFEMENKLEPERKTRLAQELGLQPRQVAVWFQNRRARWKTKQLERDYGVLKSNFDSLRRDFDFLSRDKAHLLAEIRKLKAKLGGEETRTTLSFSSVKEEPVASVSENKPVELIYKDGSSDSSNSSAVLNKERSCVMPEMAEDSVDTKTYRLLSTFHGDGDALFQKVEEMDEDDSFLDGHGRCGAHGFFENAPASLLDWYNEENWG